MSPVINESGEKMGQFDFPFTVFHFSFVIAAREVTRRSSCNDK
jgi:hypothetical protein